MFEETSSSSSHKYSPSIVKLEILHHDDSSLENPNPPNFDEDSSSSTLDGNNEDEDSHSSPSYHLEVNINSPLEFLASRPLWAQKIFESIGDWLDDPSYTRRTRLQLPHCFNFHNIFEKLKVFLSVML